MASVRNVEVLGVVSMVLVVGVASEDRAKIGRAQAIQTKIQRPRLRRDRITGRKSPLVITAPRGRKLSDAPIECHALEGLNADRPGGPRSTCCLVDPATSFRAQAESLRTRPLASREPEVSPSPGAQISGADKGDLHSGHGRPTRSRERSATTWSRRPTAASPIPSRRTVSFG